MTPIQQIQEQARAEFESKDTDGLRRYKEGHPEKHGTVLHKENLAWLDSLTVKTWNAALDEAIGALPESMIANGMHDWGEVNGYNGAIQESRTALEALKIPV